MARSPKKVFISPSGRTKTPKKVRQPCSIPHLSRARAAVGDDTIIFEDNLYQISPAVEVRCDAQELESFTTEARLLSPRDPRTEELWRKAAALYQGEFLPSVLADWVWSRRDDLHEAYIEALIGLGECARARDDVHSALNAFKRALDEEPYREDINRSIMICYADLGEKHQIILQFNKLKELLRQELAVEPSAETVELANRLAGLKRGAVRRANIDLDKLPKHGQFFIFPTQFCRQIVIW